MKNIQNAIGVLETNYYANTVVVVDQALKAAEVEIVSCHKTLGGRMCHTVLAGQTSAILAAMEAARGAGRLVGESNIKVSVSISNPHPQVWKLLNMIERHEAERNPGEKPESRQEIKQEIRQESGQEIKQEINQKEKKENKEEK
ncbi:MAG: BMC domain-containing protein [Lacrimispora sp.]